MLNKEKKVQSTFKIGNDAKPFVLRLRKLVVLKLNGAVRRKEGAPEEFYYLEACNDERKYQEFLQMIEVLHPVA